MLLVDLNLILYALDEDCPQHDAALTWWEATLSGTEKVCLAWSVILGFLRVSTKRVATYRTLPPQKALAIVDEWLAHPNVRVLSPAHTHWKVLSGLITELGTAGNITTDAHLAALAIEHGATLCSTDTDFARFDGLKWRNPLKARK